MNPYGSAAQPRRFGFGSGLAAGLLGAGLLGMLTGHGFFGGIGGVMSLFGLLFQLLLIGGLISLGLSFFRNRFAGPVGNGVGGRPGFGARMPFGGLGGGLGGGMAGRGFGASARPIEIQPADFNAFERMLTEIQAAYSREDMGTLSRMATPEVMRYFGTDLEDNRRRGVRNDVSQVRLLQGDLSEAWREATTDYATVAMRFAARDVMIERSSGRIAAGDPNHPVEAVEMWTFRRDAGGPWLLSGVQQTQ